MTYTLFWTRRSEKDLAKLSADQADRIVTKIESIADDPHRTAEPCEGYPWYHQRVGKYRAVLTIDDTDLKIWVLKVGLRKNVYDR
ncbi:MAG: plasmid stabilization protein [Methanomicrobiales archaeon HGW-Methanomicrobiales-3]|nr:MAG: plasmid stabilization protein [Methanomicrobiales archaeon HGW-Methanomicrobiales-3]